MKKATIFWLYNLLSYFKLYIFSNNRVTRSALINLKNSISDISFIKIDKSLSVNKLLNKASTISI